MRGKRRRPSIPKRYAVAMRRLAGEPPWRPLVALSGGADSTALLIAAAEVAGAGAAAEGETAKQGRAGAPLATLDRRERRARVAPARPLTAITACYVDHGARGDEDAAAAAFCHELCARLGVRFMAIAIDVKPDGKGWEDAARRERYAALADAREEAGADWVLTGHTADDVAETVLMRLARGASSRGLGGIPERTGYVLRPLLSCRRAELRDWLAGLVAGEGPLAGLAPPGSPGPWLEDPTNADPSFTRNRIRADVLPTLEAVVPGAVDSIAQAAALLGDDDAYLDGKAREELARAAVPPSELKHHVRRGLKLEAETRAWDASRLRLLPGPLLRRAVRAALIAAGAPGDELEAVHIVAIAENIAREGFALELPGALVARVRRGLLLVEGRALK